MQCFLLSSRGQHTYLENPDLHKSRENLKNVKTILYLEKGVNFLLINSIHVVFCKQLEVRHKSVAWSDIPGMERGHFFIEHASKSSQNNPKLSQRQ